MIDCAAIRDEMPGKAHDQASWSAADATHLGQCAECALEWRVVAAGARLGAGTEIDADQAARAVLARLRAEPVERSIAARLPWRGALIGLVAAAAILVLFLSAPGLQRRRPGNSVDTASLAIFPELQRLDDSELERLLRSLGPVAGDATPGTLPHIEDLTDAELEQLLGTQGGGG